MTAIPELATDRLLLRGHRVEDLDAIWALHRDPDVMRFITGEPISREETWSRMLRHRGMWAMYGFGYLVVVEKSTGRIIGECGVQERMREIDPPLLGTLEAGWMLAADVQGLGYATEAMKTVFAWCAGAHADKQITCMINTANERSIQLAEKLGMARQCATSYHGDQVVIFALPPIVAAG
ncbi:GNAT family N-acetyltransferase [Oricola sp.]|uniref:GNAT family N-acetyltransferase n=1 Tax=Oricola sp. TaxID=1979950 RepID=UPI003BAD1C19